MRDYGRSAVVQFTCTLVIALLACGWMSTPAKADTAHYEITNLTLSGGDPTYDVATDVTFTNLVLTETFADSFSEVVTLPQNWLDTLTIVLDTAAFTLPDPVHGSLTQATLTGSLSVTDLEILTTFGGTPFSATVLPDFSATLVNPNITTSVVINAVDVNSGATYGLGNFSAQVTPEPATLTLMASGIAALWAGRKRRAAITNHSSQEANQL